MSQSLKSIFALKPLVIYHKDCTDGLAAAWCFWRQFQDGMEYYPGVYNEPPPDVKDRCVFLVDFSYPREVIKAMCKEATMVFLIDHHKSALESLAGLEDELHPKFIVEHSSLDHSGAVLAWHFVKDYGHHDREMPKLLEYIEDRDLWKNALPGSAEVAAAIFSHARDFPTYNRLLEDTPVEALIAEGTTLLRKHRLDVDNIIRSTLRRMKISNFDVPVVNAPGMYASDVGAIISKGEPFGVVYYDNEHHRCFSLRSQLDGEDVARIASLFGGGGHKHAAGFKVPRSHQWAMS